MAQSGSPERRGPQDPWSVVGLTRRAALGFLGAGAGFGIAAADKLWREGLPIIAPPPPSEEIEPLVGVAETTPRTLAWALAVQYAPEATFVAEAFGFLRVARQSRGERRLLPGCRRLIELSQAAVLPDADAVLTSTIDVLSVLGATGWLAVLDRRIASEVDRLPRSKAAVRRVLQERGR